MTLDFVNREREIAELERAARAGGLLVVFGRRRIGKSRMLRQWLDEIGGLYTQAIEGQPDMQLAQVHADLKDRLEIELQPKSWEELFQLLTLQKKPFVLCIDEFPYLTASDPSLPSHIQRFLDHKLPKGALIVLAGSSTAMMNDLFLNRSAPLFGRAHKLMKLGPMDYAAFTRACDLDPRDLETFDRFAQVGGIPKYWEFVDRRQSATQLADSLYFDFSPYMEQEPHRILRDECVTGLNPVTVLEAIGRGAERPSEIANRVGTAQTNLSRVLQQLLDAAVLEREIPFGESMRSTKRTLYRIRDPALRFWFRVYSPHRSRWAGYTDVHKRELIHDHAATVFEDHIRVRYPEAARYWEPGIEIDFLAPDPDRPRVRGAILVVEVKWRKLTAKERKTELAEVERKWRACRLAERYAQPRFEVIDCSALTS